jgi:hypothetical protein
MAEIYDTNPDNGKKQKRWGSSLSRTAKRVANNLGIIDKTDSGPRVQLHRSDKLNTLQAYYENRQYNSLAPWEPKCGDDYVKVRQRKPRIIVPFAKTLSSRIASKLVSKANFPTLKIEDDPEATEFFKAVMKAANLQAKLAEPVRETLALGSGFVRFYLVPNAIKVEHYGANYCYPEFDEAGQLEFVRVQYVYYSEGEYDQNGEKLRRWFRRDFGKFEEIDYDNPVYDPEATSVPEFQETERVTHNLGFVQGEWFRTSENTHTPDGFSLHEDIMPFIDELCYNLSQSSQAIGYNQDPQLLVSGMDVDMIDNLIRSSQKAWNMGREGKAEFLEASLTGPQMGTEFRKEVKQYAQDATRIVFLEPEKMAAHAQSGRAMEVLHGPMVELVEELRPIFEPSFIQLVLKMGMATLMMARAGMPVPVTFPPAWFPASLNMSADWPPVFPMTLEDLQKKVSIAASLGNSRIMSKETMTGWLARDFGVEDIQEELAKIEAQPIDNPFGGF